MSLANATTWKRSATSTASGRASRTALADAVLVADRFHVVALANDLLTQVRQRVIRETEGRRGRPGRVGLAAAPCSTCPAPTPNATSSARGWTASTSRQPPPTHPRHTAWPPPSKPGGRRSKQPSPPGIPTPDPRATTAWPNTKDVTPSGSATRSTNDVEYGGPVPASTGGPQPREA